MEEFDELDDVPFYGREVDVKVYDRYTGINLTDDLRAHYERHRGATMPGGEYATLRMMAESRQ